MVLNTQSNIYNKSILCQHNRKKLFGLILKHALFWNTRKQIRYIAVGQPNKEEKSESSSSWLVHTSSRTLSLPIFLNDIRPEE